MAEPRAGRRGIASLERLAPRSPFSATVGLAVAFALVLAAYVLSGFAPVLLLLVALTVTGADRIVRLHPQARFHGPTATALYLFVPGLLAVGTGLALAQLDGALWKLVLSVLFSLLLLLTVRMEYLTVDLDTETYELARFLLLLAIYVTAFLIFIVAFIAGLPLVLSMAAVGVAALLLTADIVRELEADTSRLWLQSGAVAVVIAEVRLALYFLSLADVLAGAFLLITFYVATSLVQNQASGRLDARTWRSYAAVAAVGFAIILLARVVQS